MNTTRNALRTLHLAPRNLPGVRVAGWGTCLPSRVVPNEMFEKGLGLEPGRILERTGISSRHWASDGESTASLATHAAAAAIQHAGLDPDELRLVVVATSTPEFAGFPATASLVQAGIGARRAGAADVGAGCSGFLYALTLASDHVRVHGGAALVVGAEVFSRVLDANDPVTLPLFGDGAGALLLTTDRAEPGRGLLASVLRSDGEAAEVLALPAGGARRPASAATVAAGEHFLRMDGRRSARAMLELVPLAVADALEQAGLHPSEVDVFVPQDANARLTRELVSRIGLEPHHVATQSMCLANTGAAAIPLALAAALEAGRLRDDMRVLLAAFGAGYAWGSLVWRW